MRIAVTTYERLELFLSVCQAMSYAHAHRIVHCDLKPANILVDHSGRPFVIDFGLSHVYDAVLHAGSSSVIAGTPAYMSPEQVSGAFREVSEKSDTYALGLILYELLTGQLPYQIPHGGSIEQFRQVITEVVPASLSQYSTAYDLELDTIVGQALDKRQADRMTVTALRTRLERYLTSPLPATTMQQPVTQMVETPVANGNGPAPVEEGRRYACLIGTNKYHEDIFPLTPYPEANVDALAEQLEAQRIGNFDEVVRLKNPTHTEVIREVKNLSGRLGETDLLLIYYSGYAIIDEEDTGKLYLAVQETEADEIPSTSIDVERLRTFLNKCQAQQKILIFDCHYLNEPDVVDAQLASRQAGICIVSHPPDAAAWGAAPAGELNSPLTKYLIQGLGPEGAKPDPMGRVTVGQWLDYVQQQMLERELTEPRR